jgi:hypothetical protein
MDGLSEVDTTLREDAFRGALLRGPKGKPKQRMGWDAEPPELIPRNSGSLCFRTLENNLKFLILIGHK